MKTFKVELVRSNNERTCVVTLAEDERTAKIIAPDYLTYKAREPRAEPLSAKEV